MSLNRRTLLKPGKPLKPGNRPVRRTPLAVGAGLAPGDSGLIRQARIKARSKKAAREARKAQPVIAAVKERDGGCVLRGHELHTCFGGLEAHHLRKASQGGKWTAGNLVTLCALGNQRVEDHPRWAWELGLVVRDGDTSAEVWARMTAAGLPVSTPPGDDERRPDDE